MKSYIEIINILYDIGRLSEFIKNDLNLLSKFEHF